MIQKQLKKVNNFIFWDEQWNLNTEENESENDGN